MSGGSEQVHGRRKVERGFIRERRPRSGGAKPWRGEKAQESIGLVGGLTPDIERRTHTRSQALKSGCGVRFGARRGNGKRVAGVERRDDFAVRGKFWRAETP
jgi:hypothetical protein